MIATLFGSIGGLALGVTGGGGAILTIPLLVYCLHVPVHQALLLSLFVVWFTSFLSVLTAWCRQYLDLKVALVVSTGGILVAPLGASLSQSMRAESVLLGFSLLMLVIGVGLLYKVPAMAKLNEHAVAHRGGCSRKPMASWHLLFFCGGISGLLSGFFGVGGGFIIVPSLTVLVMLPMRQAVSTSLLVIFITSTAGILGHMQSQSVNWPLLLSFLFGSALGVWVGGIIAKRLSERWLYLLTAFMVFGLGLWLFLFHFFRLYS